MIVKDILYAPLLISYDTTKSNHPWVALRGPVYIDFQKTMRRRLPDIFTSSCFAHTLDSALGNQRMDIQLQQYASILGQRRVLKNFPHKGSYCIFELS